MKLKFFPCCEEEHYVKNLTYPCPHCFDGIDGDYGNDWECKIITMAELANLPEDASMSEIIEPYREWMLGGKNY